MVSRDFLKTYIYFRNCFNVVVVKHVIFYLFIKNATCRIKHRNSQTW